MHFAGPYAMPTDITDQAALERKINIAATNKFIMDAMITHEMITVKKSIHNEEKTQQIPDLIINSDFSIGFSKPLLTNIPAIFFQVWLSLLKLYH